MRETPSYRDFLYEHETDVHLSFYSAIGRVCVLWANIEFQIDITSQGLFDHLGGNDLTKDPPFNFGKKLDFIRTCLNKLPNIQKPRWFDNLATELKEASLDRNKLVHTHWESLHCEKPPRLMSGNSINPDRKGSYFLTGATVEYESIIEFTDHLSQLNGNVLSLTFLISQARDQSISEKSLPPQILD